VTHVTVRTGKPDRIALIRSAIHREAGQATEDQFGLDCSQRRDVQRRLTGLGFDTKVTGKSDDATRAVITCWQAARGYPKSGFINALQLKPLQSEIVATRGDPVAKPSRQRRCVDNKSARCELKHVAREQKPKK
jgi:hypothetical protein